MKVTCDFHEQNSRFDDGIDELNLFISDEGKNGLVIKFSPYFKYFLISIYCGFYLKIGKNMIRPTNFRFCTIVTACLINFDVHSLIFLSRNMRILMSNFTI